MYDFSNYERTYNRPIDECANIISCARANFQPLKALHLHPFYFEWFKSGVQTLMNRPLLDDENLEFDGVNIEKGSKLQRKNIVAEFYADK